MNPTVEVKIHPTEEQKVFHGVYRINVDTLIILFPLIEKSP